MYNAGVVAVNSKIVGLAPGKLLQLFLSYLFKVYLTFYRVGYSTLIKNLEHFGVRFFGVK
jgi:hypothetical protein